MYEIAKKAREKMKAKARSLAGEKDQKTDSSDWSPAEPLNADAKTGLRPISPRNFKKGGKVVGKVDGAASKSRADRKARKSGGRVESEIGVGMANKNMKEANQSREGVKHIGGLKKGGKVARKDGGNVPSDKETMTNKDRIGTEKIKPVRGAAQHYKKGGACGKADGGSLPSPEEALGSEVRMKGLKVMPSQANSAAAEVTPAQLKREEGYTQADMKAKRKSGGRAKKMDGGPSSTIVPVSRMKFGQDVVTPGLKKGGKAAGGEKWIQGAIEKPGALRKSLGVKEGEKIPAKKLHEAAEKGGKLGKRARLAETLGRMNRKSGGRTGKGKTNINIVIAAGQRQPQDQSAVPGPGAAPIAPVPMPAPAPGGAPPMGAGMPPAAAPPMGGGMPMPGAFKKGGRVKKFVGGPMVGRGPVGGGAPMPMVNRGPVGGGAPQLGGPLPMAGGAPQLGGPLPMAGNVPPPIAPAPMPPVGRVPQLGGPGAMANRPMMRKSGGRVSKVAKSYKDMTAGSGSGEGRLQKTDIAKLHKDAPARKSGGRAKSYKDMTAGSGSGEGRIQKTEIEKSQRLRGK